MKKIYLTEHQFNKYLRILSEEEYCHRYRIGPFANEALARYELDRLRKESGFSKYDSWVDGKFVVLEIEENKFDADYVGNIIASVKRRYRRVSENRD